MRTLAEAARSAYATDRPAAPVPVVIVRPMAIRPWPGVLRRARARRGRHEPCVPGRRRSVGAAGGDQLLPPELAAGVSAERFRREIQLAAQLQHPGIVPLLTAGADGDLLWYVMPYVEGESRRTRLPATSRPRGDRRQRGGGTCRVHWPLCGGGALRRSRARLLWPPATDAPHSSSSGRLMSAAARHAQGCDSPVRSISSANPTR